MSMELISSVLIGLGEQGTSLAEAVSRELSVTSPALTELSRVVCLDSDGGVRLQGSPCEEVAPIPLSNRTLAPGVWGEVHRAFADNCGDFIQRLDAALQSIGDAGVRSRLRQQGFEVRPDVHLYFISSVFDPVGSAVLTACLVEVERVLHNRYKGKMHADLVLLLPELYFRGENKLALARSYCTFAEIDHLLSHSASDTGTLVHVDNVWVLDRYFEGSGNLGSSDQLVPILSEAIRLFLTRSIKVDQSPGGVLSRQVKGKGCHFSSFGLCKLVYPSETIANALRHFVMWQVLERLPGSRDSNVDRGETFAEIRKFLSGQSLDRLPALMLTARDGTELWKPFAYDGELVDSVRAAEFDQRLSEQARQFENTSLATALQAVSRRQDELSDDFAEYLESRTRAMLDARSGNELNIATAFLSGLIGEEFDMFAGELAEKPVTLLELEEEIYDYFYDHLSLRSVLARLTELSLTKARLSGEAEAEAIRREVLSTRGADRRRQLLAASEFNEANDEAVPEMATGLSDSESEVQERLQKIETEIAELEAQVLAGKQIIQDEHRANAAIRMQFERRKANEGNELYATLVKSEEKLEKLQTELNDLLDSQSHFVRIFFVLFPTLLLFLISLAAASIYVLFSLSIGQVLKYGIVGGGLVLTGYGLWAVLRYVSRIRTPIRSKKHAIRLEGMEKRNAMIAMQRNRQELLRFKFDFYRYRKLLEWHREAMAAGRNMLKHCRDFAAMLVRLKEASFQQWSETRIEDTQTERYALQKEDLTLRVTKDIQLSREISAFLTRSKPSTYFADFMRTNEANLLVDQVKDLARVVFNDLLSVNVEQYLEDRGSADRALVHREIVQFYEDTQVLARLQVDRGADESSSLVSVGTTDPEDSYVRRVLQSKGLDRTCTFYAGHSPNQVVGFKQKIGFPAYYLSQVIRGRQFWVQSEDRRAFLVETDLELVDLLPSEFEIGYEDDDLRRIASLSLATGLVLLSRDGVHRNGDHLARSYREFVQHLGAKGSRTLVKQLAEQLSKLRQDPEQYCLQLATFVEQEMPGIDHIDREIIQKEMSRHSPLA